MRAVTSASNIHRRQACPGSEKLEAGLPEEESEQSKEGRLLHEYDANPKLDRSFLTDDHRRLVNIAAELDEAVFQRVHEQFGISPDEPFEEGREREFVALPGDEAETPGHCDRFRYWPERKLLVVIDKKFGRKIVTPAAANYQLRTYALGGLVAWSVTDCVVAITQPRLSFEERITMAAYTSDDFYPAARELRAIREECRKPDAPLIVGPEQCRYCKAALTLTCPAFRESMTESMGGVAAVTSNDASVVKRQGDVEALLHGCSDEQLDKILVALQFAEFIKDNARDIARARVAQGRLTNWQVGKESEVRKIADPARAIRLLTLRGDLTRDEVLECCKPSLKSLQDKLHAKRKCTFKEAKEAIESTLEPVLEREPKKPSLTRVK